MQIEPYFKKSMIAAGISAAVIVTLGYMLDDDPSYINVFRTVAEALFLLALFFIICLSVFLSIYWIFDKMRNFFKA